MKAEVTREIDWWTLRCNCRWMKYPHGDTRCSIEEPTCQEWPKKPCGDLKGNCPVWEKLKAKRQIKKGKKA